MKEYHKIQTVFKRDMATKHKTLLEGQYSLPEFEYLAYNKWIFTEKVDGTNIRIMYRHGVGVTFGGKTDAAQIPAKLVERLNKDFLSAVKWQGVFDCDACLYGEGYGAGIQSGGNYCQDQTFILFDVKIGEWWLQRKDVEEIAEKLGIQVVPIIGYGTLIDAIELTRDGFRSQWGSNFTAEGIVARPAVELKARNGDRIITKIKHKDFPVSK